MSETNESEGAVSAALLWLRGALDCKEFAWDADQREAAEQAYAAAVSQSEPASVPNAAPAGKVFCEHCWGSGWIDQQYIAPEPDTCLSIPDWALARAYRIAVGELDIARRVSALAWASNITVSADLMARKWSNSVKDYRRDPRSLAQWLRIHKRDSWATMENHVPEFLWIHEILSHCQGAQDPSKG